MTHTHPFRFEADYLRTVHQSRNTGAVAMLAGVAVWIVGLGWLAVHALPAIGPVLLLRL